jgi:hypothetical protein
VPTFVSSSDLSRVLGPGLPADGPSTEPAPLRTRSSRGHPADAAVRRRSPVCG